MRISQSMIKSLIDYHEGNLCGLVFEEKFVNNNFDKFLATDAMAVGTWFEYELTGALPKDGRKPEPKRKRDGELRSEYKRMLKHIQDFKATMMYYGFEIVSVGEKIKHGDMEGTLDLRCQATQKIITPTGIVIDKGEQFIVDLKTSGLLDNKWMDYGWEIENLANKYKIVIQPIMYKYIEYLNTGKDIKFLFFLYNTADENDSRIINFICDDEAFDELKVTIENSRKLLRRYMGKWEARPSKKVCSKCPIKVGCKGYTAVPPITDFYFDTANM